MPARLIYNPVAGNGSGLHTYQRIVPYLEAHGVEAVATKYAGHATELAREVAGDPTMTVISLGGDGTHHEVINGLLPQGHATFAVIPAGTGNDFVRILGYPPTLREQLDLALHGDVRRIDVGRVAHHYYLTVAGVGFDAEVANWVNHHPKRQGSTWTFLKGILVTLLKFRPQPIEVISENGRKTAHTFMIAAGNTAYYAGGMRICPDADPSDGQLAVIWIGKVAPWAIFPLLLRVFRGTHITRPQVETFQSRFVTVNGPSRLWVHADGELVSQLPVSIEVVPQALTVRCGDSQRL